MRFILIRELEGKTGLERANIRYYEKEGFLSPVRQENGYRMYTEEDCHTLLKIKLLRQLGMTLDKIRAIQQGSGDFEAALSEQISILDGQSKAAKRAQEICRQIQHARIQYASLDAQRYTQHYI